MHVLWHIFLTVAGKFVFLLSFISFILDLCKLELLWYTTQSHLSFRDSGKQKQEEYLKTTPHFACLWYNALIWAVRWNQQPSFRLLWTFSLRKQRSYYTECWSFKFHPASQYRPMMFTGSASHHSQISNCTGSKRSKLMFSHHPRTWWGTNIYTNPTPYDLSPAVTHMLLHIQTASYVTPGFTLDLHWSLVLLSLQW